MPALENTPVDVCEGYRRLMAAAVAHYAEPVCPGCFSPDFKTIADESNCAECGLRFAPDDAPDFNFLADAQRIRSVLNAGPVRFEHIETLGAHAEECHQRIAELEELLAIERGRNAEARRKSAMHENLGRVLAGAA